jgi:protein-L-isoaspartate O-methyltransferase
MLRSDMQEMLRTIEMETRMTQGFTGVAALRPKVMEAMASVPRHEFVPEHLRHQPMPTPPCPSVTARPSPSPLSSLS